MIDDSIDALLPANAAPPTGAPIDFQSLPARPGVVLLADAAGRPVLLALGQNLRQLIHHRLTAPVAEGPTRRANLAEVTRQLRWRETFSRFESMFVHWRCARLLQPRAYRKSLAFGSAWMVRVDPGAAHPRFEATSTFRASDAATAIYFGPYATRKLAEQWIAALEDLFDLCRYHDILVQAPHGEACAYFEMGKCPAPCNGTIAMEAYREMIASAAAFTAGDRAAAVAGVEARMQRESAALRFERAAAIHKSLRAASELAARPEYASVTDVTHAAWLVFQRGSRPSRRMQRVGLAAFAAGPCGIRELGTAPLADAESAATAWLAAAGEAVGGGGADAAVRSEAFWLIARHLLTAGGKEGVIVPVGSEPASAAAAVRAAFKCQTKDAE